MKKVIFFYDNNLLQEIKNMGISYTKTNIKVYVKYTIPYTNKIAAYLRSTNYFYCITKQES